MLGLKKYLIVLVVTSIVYAVMGESCGQTDGLPDPSSGCCGLDVAEDKHSGSGDAAFAQFPWLVFITHNNLSHMATGVLISSRFVLTSGIFYYKPLPYALLGEVLRNKTGPDCREINGVPVRNNGAVSIPIESVANHKQFLSDYWPQHDISVLKLAQRAPYNEFIRPICLPSYDITAKPSQQLIHAGWRDASPSGTWDEVYVKHYQELSQVPLKKCQEKFLPIVHATISEAFICAGDVKDPNPCKNVWKHGSILMSEEKGRYTVEGILSYGTYSCERNGTIAFYGGTFSSMVWIRNTTSSLLGIS